MYKINIRHKLYLHSKKIAVAFLLCAGVFSFGKCLAQEQYNNGGYKGNPNLPNYDDKVLHYGFTIGANTTRFKMVYAANYLSPQSDSILSVQSQNSGGFSLGFIVNLRLHNHWDLRLLPTVAFYDRTVKYKFTYTQSAQTTQSTFIEIPLLLKYKSQRRRNSRMYVVGGLKGGIEAGAKKKEKKETELRTQNKDLCVDFGVGFDIYYPLFKFSPEIRISQGIPNMLVHDPNPYALSLKSLTSHTVTLYLHFE
jgi:hypothetical protein